MPALSRCPAKNSEPHGRFNSRIRYDEDDKAFKFGLIRPDLNKPKKIHICCIQNQLYSKKIP